MRKMPFLALVLFASGCICGSVLYARGADESGNVPAPAASRNLAAPEQTIPEEKTDKIDVDFFYEELCKTCYTDINNFTSILTERLPLAERNQYPNSINMNNIYESEGRARYAALTDELGLDRGNLEPPLLIIGGKTFQGYDSISANIKEAYLTAAEDLYVNKRPYNPRERKSGANLFEDYPVNPDNVTVVYFYRITCPECVRVTPIINTLPEKVLVNGVERPLDIIKINTRSGNNGERIAAFFEAWQVPDSDRMVPIVFFAGSYLAGIDRISAGLQNELEKAPAPWKLLPEH